MSMYLGECDAKRFYKIWLGLLDFTNKKHKIVPQLNQIVRADAVDLQGLIPIKNKLWEDKYLIDEYLSQYENSLSTSEVEIIKSWKRRTAGKFIIFKYLKKYAVFISVNEGGRLYIFNGITKVKEYLTTPPND